LQHAARFAFLARLTGFAMLGGTFHVVAAVLPIPSIIAMPMVFIGHGSVDA
jgi:hypothetical protein